LRNLFAISKTRLPLGKVLDGELVGLPAQPKQRHCAKQAAESCTIEAASGTVQIELSTAQGRTPSPACAHITGMNFVSLGIERRNSNFLDLQSVKPGILCCFTPAFVVAFCAPLR
jgi:hypothetical protein